MRWGERALGSVPEGFVRPRGGEEKRKREVRGALIHRLKPPPHGQPAARRSGEEKSTENGPKADQSRWHGKRAPWCHRPIGLGGTAQGRSVPRASSLPTFHMHKVGTISKERGCDYVEDPPRLSIHRHSKYRVVDDCKPPRQERETRSTGTHQENPDSGRGSAHCPSQECVVSIWHASESQQAHQRDRSARNGRGGECL